MSDSLIYLDHAATTPVHPDVADLMGRVLRETSGNPSSLHQAGRQSRLVIEKARGQVALLLNAEPDEIIFTGSGSEADNMAVLGVCRQFEASSGKKGHVITSVVEHPAVLNPVKLLEKEGWTATILPVNEDGRVTIESVQEAITDETVLISVMAGNNEVGSLQPIQEMATLVHQRRESGQSVYLHTDAVQVAGKLPIDVKALGVDYLSLSAHKIYGAKGVGALYVSSSAVSPQTFIHGGGQESGLRSGTENISGIAGFGLACELRQKIMVEEAERLRDLTRYFRSQLAADFSDIAFNTPGDSTIPGLINVSFNAIDGEAMVLKLDMKGVSASSGSACHSKSIEPSRVVLAMSGDEERALSTVRFSMGSSTTKAQLDQVIEALGSIIARAEKRQKQSV